MDENMTPKTTNEVDLAQEAISKSEEKTAQLLLQQSPDRKRNIIPFVLQGDTDTDFVTGYFYEPDGITDAKLMAAKLTGWDAALPKAIQALESLILTSESDPRCNQKKYLNGAALILLSTVEIATPVTKKK